MSVNWLREFNDEGLHFILMFLALAYILISRKEKYHRRLFIGYSLLFTVVYFCPVTSWVITRAIGELVYWRMLWMMPLPIIIAYAGVKIWCRIEKKWQRGLSIAALAAVLVLLGQFIYLDGCPYEKRTNWEKIPESPVAICNIINADRKSKEEWVLLAAPEDMVPYIRVYDGSIHQVYGRKGDYWKPGSGGYYIVKTMNQLLRDNIEPDYEKLIAKCRRISCNYIVLPDGNKRVENMEAYHFEEIGRVGNYIIFKDTDWKTES